MIWSLFNYWPHMSPVQPKFSNATKDKQELGLQSQVPLIASLLAASSLRVVCWESVHVGWLGPLNPRLSFWPPWPSTFIFPERCHRGFQKIETEKLLVEKAADPASGPWRSLHTLLKNFPVTLKMPFPTTQIRLLPPSTRPSPLFSTL